MQINKFFGVQSPSYFPDENLDVDVPDDTTEEEEEVVEEDDDKNDSEGDGSEEDEEEDTEDKEEKDEDDKEEEVVRLNWRGIKEKFGEKYPDLLKDPEFKKIKNTVYREQEFTKIFPDPKDAEEALTAQANYDDLKELVLSGDTEKLLTSIGEVSDKSLDKFASSFLPSLRKADNKLYVKVTTPIIRKILADVVRYGERHDHKETGANFVKAAKVVNKAIFDDYELGKVEELEPKKDDELEKDRADFLNTKQKSLLDSLVTETDEELEDLIGEIDPGKVLKDRPKLKAKIVKEIISDVKEALDKDSAHGSRMSALWAREKRTGFSGALKDSIKTTFLSRAKVLIPEIRKRIRTEYLGHVKDSDTSKREKLESRDRNIPPGRNLSSTGKRIPTAAEAKKKGLTPRQILDIE